MVGIECEFFRRHFGWKVFDIHLLLRTFKEKLKIQGDHPFKLGFGYRFPNRIDLKKCREEIAWDVIDLGLN